MRNNALPHLLVEFVLYARVDEDWGWRRRSCVCFSPQQSSSEVFGPFWSSGKPVVKVCHCNTQVAYDFLTHWLEKRPPSCLGCHCHLHIAAINCCRKSGPHPLGCRGEKVCFGATCQVVGITFHPPRHRVPIGGVSEMTADTISSLGRLLGQRLGISPIESTRHLYQRLAIFLWRGNASA